MSDHYCVGCGMPIYPHQKALTSKIGAFHLDCFERKAQVAAEVAAEATTDRSVQK